YWRHRDKT
ncbi:lysR substrate binding domain protein, partial [Vibrio parahaemolyticus V-223/04]